MGRPHVDDKDKRVVQVNIRLTEDEYKKVSEYADSDSNVRQTGSGIKYSPESFRPLKFSVIDAYDLL